MTAGPPDRPIDLGGPRQRTVLALLVAGYGRTVTIDHLIDELWPARLPGNPRKTVQTYVSNLRRIVADTGVRVERDGEGYRLRADATQLDLAAFDAALAAAAGAPSSPDRLRELRLATRCFHADPFTNVGESRSLTDAAAHLTERFLDAEQERLTLELEVGDAATVVADAERLLARYPWRERLWEVLLDGLAATGRAGEADRTFARARDAIVRELGVEVSPRLEDALRRSHGESGNQDGPGRPPLPPPLERRLGADFVGREAERVQLLDHLARARNGTSIVIIEGEAGIGKTRLAAEFAADAHRAGATVLTGRCDEHVRPPFRALSEILDRLADHEGDAAVVARGGPEGAEFARLRERFGTPPPGDDVDVQRHRLATATANLLRSLSADEPVVVVIDDLQWAGEPTWAYLTHLATTNVDLRCLVVATVRSGEVDVAGPVRSFLLRLRQIGAVDEICLDGLDPDAVGRLVGLDRGALVHEYTGGNPLFLTEIAQHLAAGGELGPNDRLTDVVRHRIERLGPSVTETLRRASVIGSPFAMATLCRFPGVDAPVVAAALDQAQRHGVIRPIGAELTYEFSHALVGDALYLSMPTEERVLGHATLAEALSTGEANDVASAAEIARHWAVAAPAGYAGRAIAALRHAAALARRSFGSDEAVDLLERACDLAEQTALPPRQRAELLVELAGALAETGSTLRCTDRACEVGDLAAEHGLVDLVVEAALCLTGGDVFSDPAHGVAARGLIGRALPFCEPGSVTWARLRSKALIGDSAVVPAVELDGELDALLDAVHDDMPPSIVRQVVENVSFISVGERHDECVELLRRASEPDDPSTRNPYLYEKLTLAVDHADGAMYRSLIDEYRATSAGNHAHSMAAESAAAVTAFWDGRTHEGSRRGVAVMADALGHRPQSGYSGFVAWAEVRALLAGRPWVIEPLAAECSRHFRIAMFDGALAWAEASRGDPSRIRARVERHSGARIRLLTMPRLGGPPHWPTVMACIADASPPVLAYARELIDLVGGPSGPAFHALPHTPAPALAHLSAMVADAEGDVGRAVEEGRRAVEDYRSMTAHVFVPLALADLSAYLVRHGRPEDRAEARTLAAEALDGAKRFRVRAAAASARRTLALTNR